MTPMLAIALRNASIIKVVGKSVGQSMSNGHMNKTAEDMFALQTTAYHCEDKCWN